MQGCGNDWGIASALNSQSDDHRGAGEFISRSSTGKSEEAQWNICIHRQGEKVSQWEGERKASTEGLGDHCIILAYNQLLLFSWLVVSCLGTGLICYNCDNIWNKEAYLCTFSCVRALTLGRRGYCIIQMLVTLSLLFTFSLLWCENVIKKCMKVQNTNTYQLTSPLFSCFVWDQSLATNIQLN